MMVVEMLAAERLRLESISKECRRWYHGQRLRNADAVLLHHFISARGKTVTLRELHE